MSGSDVEWRMPGVEAIHANFSTLSRYVVVNAESKIAVEGCVSSRFAADAMNSLNEHEARCGRSGCYVIHPLPPKVFNTDPREWQRLMDEGLVTGDALLAFRLERVRAINDQMRFNYPSRIALFGHKAICKAGSYEAVDWHEVHQQAIDEILLRNDCRDEITVLKDILNFSPAAVTHQEQLEVAQRVRDSFENHFLELRNCAVRERC